MTICTTELKCTVNHQPTPPISFQPIRFGANVLHADSFGCFRQAYPVTVIRGGIRFSIPSTSVLVGDLLLLVEGYPPPKLFSTKYYIR